MNSEPEARGRRGKGPSRKRLRKPENAQLPDYENLAEMLDAIASEKRTVPTRSGDVVMSRRERSYRSMIEKAFGDDPVRELAQVLRLMIKYPEMASTYQAVIIVRGKLCDV